MRRFLLALLALSFAPALAQVAPDEVECIAPADPGGGWDFTCRVPAAEVMPALGLVGSVRVTNLPGGTGRLAMTRVVTERAGDDALIIAASAATATALAQNAYGDLTAEDVRWFGALGADFGVLAVADRSPLRDLADLVARMREDPGGPTFAGGGAAGGFDHLKPLLVAHEAGIEDLARFGYTPFDSGAEALADVLAGRSEVFTGDASEAVAAVDAGEVRVLAVLAPERIERLGDARTAREQGFDVVAGNWRGFYGPPGTSDEAYGFWVEAIRRVAQSDAWAALREENGLAPFESVGGDFERFVREQIVRMEVISRELGVAE